MSIEFRNISEEGIQRRRTAQRGVIRRPEDRWMRSVRETKVVPVEYFIEGLYPGRALHFPSISLHFHLSALFMCCHAHKRTQIDRDKHNSTV